MEFKTNRGLPREYGHRPLTPDDLRKLGKEQRRRQAVRRFLHVALVTFCWCMMFAGVSCLMASVLDGEEEAGQTGMILALSGFVLLEWENRRLEREKRAVESAGLAVLAITGGMMGEAMARYAYDQKDRRHDPCPACKGSKRIVDDIPCGVCGGTGEDTGEGPSPDSQEGEPS